MKSSDQEQFFKLLEEFTDNFCEGNKIFLINEHYKNFIKLFITHTKVLIDEYQDNIKIKLNNLLQLICLLFENNILRTSYKSSSKQKI